MRPKFYTILELALEEGIKRGYRRAFKHNDSPSEESILDSIQECTMSAIHEYFSFDDHGDK
jgi:hypothetical protein